MFFLDPASYAVASPLFAALDNHLAVLSTLNGGSEARIWVDDPAVPRSALLHVQNRFYLAGDPENTAFVQDLRQLFMQEIFPSGLSTGSQAFVLYCSPGWELGIEGVIFSGFFPVPRLRKYLEIDGPQALLWQSQVPAGLRMVEADRRLVEDKNMDNIEDLLDEMQSERRSVQAFLEKSFGCCLVSDDRVITWCLSEYNLGDRCEVGIATDPAYRRRGLAAVTGAAFVEQALGRGYRRIGWHCWADNLGSVRAALRIGFSEREESIAYLVFYRPAWSQAFRGEMSLQEGSYEDALTWLKRSMQYEDTPGWAYIDAACAAARLEYFDVALAYLRQAPAHGFCDLKRLNAIEDLFVLHNLPEWNAVEQIFTVS